MFGLYQELLARYGPQGWWPLLGLEGKAGVNPTKTGSVKGYHPGDYSYPHTREERFEICAGAILTQNTAWPNAEKALKNLDILCRFVPERLLMHPESALKEAIRPAGYYNQKAKKLRLFAEFFVRTKGTPSRTELLALWGIGKETADTILLYAYKEPVFVVDTYTRRFLARHGIGLTEYDEIKVLFESSIPKSLEIYQEYHALIVEEEKNQINEK
ncbi:MAG: endonuclease III domain-containing protein [Nanoarchaeota archaeon]|nr:endonuclease III domain-containing protein [Nanoarchaeota archaeon]